MPKHTPLLAAALALFALAGCDSNDGRPIVDPPPGNAEALNELVLDQCQRRPENEEPAPVTGRSFDGSGEFGACL